MTSPSPASVPTEEDVARAIASFRKHLSPDSRLPDILPSEMAQARAVLALFAPILAWGKTVEKYAEKSDEAYDALVEKWGAAEARALSAEAALAEKERQLNKLAEDWDAYGAELTALYFKEREGRLSAEAAIAKTEGALARYIETVGAAEGTDFIENSGFNGPDEAVLYRCSGRDENGNFTEEARAKAAAIRAQE